MSGEVERDFTRAERSMWISQIKAVAANLCRLREAAGLTQTELGRRINAPRQAIHLLESGATKHGPPFRRLVQLAAALGLESLAEFYATTNQTEQRPEKAAKGKKEKAK